MSDNRKRLCLLGQLNDKVQEEHQTYTEALYHMTVDEVIELSYKTAMMNEFKCIIENYADDALEDWQIEKLLGVHNLLETLYEDWLQFDSDVYAEKEFVFGYWDWDRIK